MTDFIIVGIVFIAVGVAIAYIVKAKKSGAHCVGCPNAKTCGAGCGSECKSNCGCGK